MAKGDAMNFNRTCVLASSVMGAVFLSAPEVGAATYTYTYTGNNFLAARLLDAAPPNGAYTTSIERVVLHARESLPANLPHTVFNNIMPLNFSFSDGRNQITDAHNTDFGFDIATIHLEIFLAGPSL